MYGRNAEYGEVPWQIILEDMNCGTLCGSTIINHRYILTAAHCIDSFKEKSAKSCPNKKNRKNLRYPANILSKYNFSYARGSNLGYQRSPVINFPLAHL